MEQECTSTGPALTHPLHLDIYIYIFAYSQGDKLDSREQSCMAMCQDRYLEARAQVQETLMKRQGGPM
jgi:hypothetical protein